MWNGRNSFGHANPSHRNARAAKAGREDWVRSPGRQETLRSLSAWDLRRRKWDRFRLKISEMTESTSLRERGTEAAEWGGASSG